MLVVVEVVVVGGGGDGGGAVASIETCETVQINMNKSKPIMVTLAAASTEFLKFNRSDIAHHDEHREKNKIKLNWG